jgi:hypothetical protein
MPPDIDCSAHSIGRTDGMGGGEMGGGGDLYLCEKFLKLDIQFPLIVTYVDLQIHMLPFPIVT